MSESYDRMERTALAVAEQFGLEGATRDRVAEAYGCAPALVTHYFGPMRDMRKAIAKRAVAERAGRVVAEAAIGGYLTSAAGVEAGGAAIEYLERRLRA